MKKYFLISIVLALFITACVKDEQPTPTPPPPVDYSKITINELITKDTTSPYYVDGLGEGADWIELYNSGTIAMNLAGMFVTDLPGSEADYIEIPATNQAATTIPPKGFLVLICGAKNADGSKVPTSIADGKIFIEMGLSSSSDNFAALYSPTKELVDQSADFNGLADDKSFGRQAETVDTWITLATKTPGAPNDGTLPAAGTLVINEFMCSNDTTFIPDNVGPDNYPDWIEIYNTGDTPIDIGGWYLTDDLTDPIQYQIPNNMPEQTIIPGHGYLLLKADGTGIGINLGFKLGSGGDDIGLSQDGVSFVDELSFGSGTGSSIVAPLPATDFSSGRMPDGSTTWQVFDPNTATGPTPGSANGM
ncbi:MAG: lamin tail domain-containing protein [Clostridia bacterium]|nr:lamin tail domain-containing protein [Clostridia bacterium]